MVEFGRRLGLRPAFGSRVRVEPGGGPEAAARRARYRALAEAAGSTGARCVVLGHTLDDQAETVLLGLGRGSGSRSLAGMREWDAPWLRPLLGVRRAVTRAACLADGVPIWDDPHNFDPRYTRTRLRHEVLPLLEDVLGDGVAEALARTADLLRADGEALDGAAAVARAAVQGPPQRNGDGNPPAPDLDAELLARYPPAIRGRVLRAWLADGRADHRLARPGAGGPPGRVGGLPAAWQAAARLPGADRARADR